MPDSSIKYLTNRTSSPKPRSEMSVLRKTTDANYRCFRRMNHPPLLWTEVSGPIYACRRFPGYCTYTGALFGGAVGLVRLLERRSPTRAASLGGGGLRSRGEQACRRDALRP